MGASVVAAAPLAWAALAADPVLASDAAPAVAAGHASAHGEAHSVAKGRSLSHHSGRVIAGAAEVTDAASGAAGAERGAAATAASAATSSPAGAAVALDTDQATAAADCDTSAEPADEDTEGAEPADEDTEDAEKADEDRGDDERDEVADDMSPGRDGVFGGRGHHFAKGHAHAGRHHSQSQQVCPSVQPATLTTTGPVSAAPLLVSLSLAPPSGQAPAVLTVAASKPALVPVSRAGPGGVKVVTPPGGPQVPVVIPPIPISQVPDQLVHPGTPSVASGVFGPVTLVVTACIVAGGAGAFLVARTR